MLKQREACAKATRSPFGYIFLPAPPEEPAPFPDFRTMGGQPVERLAFVGTANSIRTSFAALP
jgi:hypothetical protein